MGLTLEPRIVEWLIEQTGRAHPHDEPPAVCGACAVYNYLSEKWRIAHLSPLDVEHEAVNMLRRIVAARGMAWLDDEIEGANNWLARLGSAPSTSEDRVPTICAACGGTDEPVVNVPLHPRCAEQPAPSLDVELLTSTTTYDDWKAIIAEYDRRAPSRSEPEEVNE